MPAMDCLGMSPSLLPAASEPEEYVDKIKHVQRPYTSVFQPPPFLDGLMATATYGVVEQQAF